MARLFEGENGRPGFGRNREGVPERSDRGNKRGNESVTTDYESKPWVVTWFR